MNEYILSSSGQNAPRKQRQVCGLAPAKSGRSVVTKKALLAQLSTNPSWQQDWEGMGIPWALYHMRLHERSILQESHCPGSNPVFPLSSGVARENESACSCLICTMGGIIASVSQGFGKD